MPPQVVLLLALLSTLAALAIWFCPAVRRLAGFLSTISGLLQVALSDAHVIGISSFSIDNYAWHARSGGKILEAPRRTPQHGVAQRLWHRVADEFIDLRGLADLAPAQAAMQRFGRLDGMEYPRTIGNELRTLNYILPIVSIQRRCVPSLKIFRWSYSSAGRRE